MDIFYCHWELAALKEENIFMESLTGSVVVVKLVCATHKGGRLISVKSLSLSALLLFKGSDTTDLRAEATRMGSSFGEVESGRLGNPILPAECYGQGAWQSLLFEAEMVLEGWRRAEELLGSFFPKSFFF